MNDIPNFEQIKGIYKDTYLLYVKYYDKKTIDWSAFLIETDNLSQKYPFAFATKILIEITKILESSF